MIGIETEPPTEVGPHSMKLHGSFLGNGEATSYDFEYGTGPSYGSETEEVTLPSPSGPTEVEAKIEGLNPVTNYYYRFVAKDVGLSRANDRQAETLPLAPEVSGEVTTAVHSDTAVLHTQINPGGGHTSYHFEYGTAPCSSEPDPCASTPETEVGTGFANLPAQIKLSGLSGTPPTTSASRHQRHHHHRRRRTDLHHLPRNRDRQRPLPQRPRPPADRRRLPPRLPRL